MHCTFVFCNRDAIARPPPLKLYAYDSCAPGTPVREVVLHGPWGEWRVHGLEAKPGMTTREFGVSAARLAAACIARPGWCA